MEWQTVLLAVIIMVIILVVIIIGIVNPTWIEVVFLGNKGDLVNKCQKWSDNGCSESSWDSLEDDFEKICSDTTSCRIACQSVGLCY